VAETGGSLRLSIIAGAEIESYIAPKGSVALDGVSLTVNEVESLSDGVRFGVNIIPHTAAQTTFADVAPGRFVNVEIDVLARYIGRMMELRR
jgi:riboflavin synthase